MSVTLSLFWRGGALPPPFPDIYLEFFSSRPVCSSFLVLGILEMVPTGVAIYCSARTRAGSGVGFDDGIISEDVNGVLKDLGVD